MSLCQPLLVEELKRGKTGLQPKLGLFASETDWFSPSFVGRGVLYVLLLPHQNVCIVSSDLWLDAGSVEAARITRKLGVEAVSWFRRQKLGTGKAGREIRREIPGRN